MASGSHACWDAPNCAGEIATWLTVVVDTYSRRLDVSIHIGFDPPSAAVVCLAPRHAILPAIQCIYELLGSRGERMGYRRRWMAAKDFVCWRNLEQVATELWHRAAVCAASLCGFGG